MYEIRGTRINTGPIGSGTALTTTLYRLMFGESIRDASVMTNEEALAKLVTDKSAEVVAVIAGQPAKLLVDMKPESRQYIKLLKFDRNHATSAASLRTYFPTTVRADLHPNLLTEYIPALAVKAYLVTYDFKPRSHTRSYGAAGACAVPELLSAADGRPSQVARSRVVDAGTRPRMAVLPHYGERNPQLHGGQGRPAKAAQDVLAAGTRARVMRIARLPIAPALTP